MPVTRCAPIASLRLQEDMMKTTNATRMATDTTRPTTLRCPDCGERGARIGHQECPYPGRVSDRS
jgi:hypothetical protein